MKSIWISKALLKPKKSLNALQTSSTVECLVFKVQHLNQSLYTSYTFHPELDGLSSENLDQKWSLLEPILIQNFKEEWELKNSKKNYKSSLNPNLTSHYTFLKGKSVDDDIDFLNQKFKDGETRIKIKMNPGFFEFHHKYLNLLELYSNLEFIFDFNSTALLEPLLQLKWPSSVLRRVFWEDPIPFDFDSWSLLKKQGFRMILDQQKNALKDSSTNQPLPFEIVSVKPTKEIFEDILSQYPHSKILVTTNMGDELDHRISEYWAAKILNLYPQRFFGAGLNTRSFYKQAPFDLQTPDNEGFGWGLDEILNLKEWTKYKDIHFEL